MGTWKLNVEKSKFSPGPGPKSQVLTWKASATGFDFTVETVNAQGQATHNQNGGSLDGKGYVVKTATRTVTRVSKALMTTLSRRPIVSKEKWSPQDAQSFRRTGRFLRLRLKVRTLKVNQPTM